MWSDNETTTDLIGFKVHADLVEHLAAVWRMKSFEVSAKIRKNCFELLWRVEFAGNIFRKLVIKS